jgi:hypothetical protein
MNGVKLPSGAKIDRRSRQASTRSLCSRADRSYASHLDTLFLCRLAQNACCLLVRPMRFHRKRSVRLCANNAIGS